MTLSLKSIAWLSAILFGILMFAPQFGVTSAAAQTESAKTESKNIGVFMAVLDMDGAYAQSKAMKDIHQQFAKFQSDFEATVNTQKKSLQKAEEELSRKRALLAPEVFAEERKAFQKRIVALQRKVQEGKLKLNQARAKANTKVVEVLHAVIKDIVKSNNITIVFNKKTIVTFNVSMDITKIVLTELDKRLPSVHVTNPIQ